MSDKIIRLDRALGRLGISGKLTGRIYIKEAISMIEEDECVYGNLTKRIYPEIGEKYGKSPECVERAIRTALNVAWSQGDLALIDEIFGRTIDIRKGRPSNGEFLAGLSEYLAS